MDSIPTAVMRVTRGALAARPSMSSISRLQIWCSIVPAQRNNIPLEMAWKMMSRIAAAMDKGVFMPAQAMIRPRLAMVE